MIGNSLSLELHPIDCFSNSTGSSVSNCWLSLIIDALGPRRWPSWRGNNWVKGREGKCMEQARHGRRAAMVSEQEVRCRTCDWQPPPTCRLECLLTNEGHAARQTQAMNAGRGGGRNWRLGWVWEITGWGSRLQEIYRSVQTKLMEYISQMSTS